MISTSSLRAVLVFVVYATCGLAASSGPDCACNSLASTFPEVLLWPNSSTYANQSRLVWDKRSNQDPTCIFLPQTADEVATGVATFHDCNATFAIRSGGHMNYPGSNNIDDGVLMSLGMMKDLVLSDDQKTLHVNPGNKWIDVYSFLEPYGLYVIGGRLKTIGVPGLTLLGGFNYFNNKYGFAMDNVVSYDVVLGNGTQVTSNATSHSELFWALKGGVNNFGIVTKFVFQTFSIPHVSTTIQAHNETGVQDWLSALCDFVKDTGNDPSVGAGGVFSINYNVTDQQISTTILGSQEGRESPPSRFANFSTVLGRISQLDNVTTPAQFSSQFDSPLQMFRIQFGHHTVKPNATRLFQMYTTWKESLADVIDVEGLRPTFVVNPAQKSAFTIAKQNGIGNTWGMDDGQSYILWQVATSWASASDDLRMTAWSHRLVNQLHAENKALGLSSEFIYGGDAAEWQSPFARVSDVNKARLRAVQKSYDPDGTFTRLNWGGFKLGL